MNNHSDLLNKWLAHYDPIHRGFTLKGIANGVCATAGFAFPRIRGGFNLYRGTSGAESIDYDHPAGAAGADAATIANFAWRRHAPGVYHYALRAVGGGGVESPASVPLSKTEFLGFNSPVGPRPNPVGSLRVEPAAGGRFVVRWSYDERGQEAPPAYFAIAHDDGSGEIIADPPAGTVAYSPGQFHFEYLSDPFPHGARRLWAVKAMAADSTGDDGTATVSAWADAEAPAVHAGVTAAAGTVID